MQAVPWHIKITSRAAGFGVCYRRKAGSSVPEGAELSAMLASVTLQAWLQARWKYTLDAGQGGSGQVWLSIAQRFQDLTGRRSRNCNSKSARYSKSFPGGELRDSPALSSWSVQSQAFAEAGINKISVRKSMWSITRKIIFLRFSEAFIPRNAATENELLLGLLTLWSSWKPTPSSWPHVLGCLKGRKLRSSVSLSHCWFRKSLKWQAQPAMQTAGIKRAKVPKLQQRLH